MKYYLFFVIKISNIFFYNRKYQHLLLNFSIVVGANICTIILYLKIWLKYWEHLVLLLYILYIYGWMFTLNWIAQLYCLWPCVSMYWSMEMNFQIGSELLQRIFAYHRYLISWHSLSCDITIPITTWRYQWVGLQQ